MNRPCCVLSNKQKKIPKGRCLQDTLTVTASGHEKDVQLLFQQPSSFSCDYFEITLQMEKDNFLDNEKEISRRISNWLEKGERTDLIKKERIGSGSLAVPFRILNKGNDSRPRSLQLYNFFKIN